MKSEIVDCSYISIFRYIKGNVTCMEFEIFFIYQIKEISPVLSYPVPGNVFEMLGFYGNSGIRK